jgi:hypothetical protein
MSDQAQLPMPEVRSETFADWYARQDEAMKERCRLVFPSLTEGLDLKESA